MERIREKLPMVTKDYDDGNTANNAKEGDSDLDLGFRYLEEIEEEAEGERLASLYESDWDLPLGNLDIPTASTYSLEEQTISALDVRNRSFKEVNPVNHILLS